MLDPGTALCLSETFRALGDLTRLRIVHALSVREMCVCDLSVLLGVTPSAVSHQLRILRNLRLVKHRRHKKMVYYSLDDDHILGLFSCGLDHVSHGRAGVQAKQWGERHHGHDRSDRGAG